MPIEQALILFIGMCIPITRGLTCLSEDKIKRPHFFKYILFSLFLGGLVLMAFLLLKPVINNSVALGLLLFVVSMFFQYVLVKVGQNKKWVIGELPRYNEW